MIYYIAFPEEGLRKIIWIVIATQGCSCENGLTEPALRSSTELSEIGAARRQDQNQKQSHQTNSEAGVEPKCSSEPKAEPKYVSAAAAKPENKLGKNG